MKSSKLPEFSHGIELLRDLRTCREQLTVRRCLADIDKNLSTGYTKMFTI